MHGRKTPKKSETLEVRLPYATKDAFMARCRARGVTASEAVRGFIDGEIAGRRPPRRLRLAVGGAAALAAAAIALPSLARPTAEESFDRLDRNHDQRVSFAELSAAAGVQATLGPAKAFELRDAEGEPGQARLRTLVLQTIFNRLDADQDGWVSLDEYRRPEPAVRPGAGNAPTAAAARSRA